MQINDDDIRAAFAWPVRYEEESGYIRDSGNHLVLHMCGAYIQSHKMVGEAIAAMLNDRFAPKIFGEKNPARMSEICGLCGKTRRNHFTADWSCPDANSKTWHPTNRFTPKGGE